MTDPSIVQLVEAAIRAPSSHNTQPWRFREAENGIALYADRSRALPMNDPQDRELTISCGGSLFNLRLAAEHYGFDAKVSLLPDPSDSDLLADVVLNPGERRPGLFEAIAARQSTRDAFTDTPVLAEVGEKLVEAAAGYGAWLQILTDDARHEVAELVAEGDRMQFANPRWRRELASWMRPRRAGDGLIVPEVIGPLVRMIVSRFDIGRRTAAKDFDLVLSAPLLATLGTDGDSAADWLTAGQALQATLLTAAQEGLQAGFMNQPLQVSELRPRLQQALGRSGHAQLLLRVGYARKPRVASPRRPVTDVLQRLAHT